MARRWWSVPMPGDDGPSGPPPSGFEAVAQISSTEAARQAARRFGVNLPDDPRAPAHAAHAALEQVQAATGYDVQGAYGTAGGYLSQGAGQQGASQHGGRGHDPYAAPQARPTGQQDSYGSTGGHRTTPTAGGATGGYGSSATPGGTTRPGATVPGSTVPGTTGRRGGATSGYGTTTPGTMSGTPGLNVWGPIGIIFAVVGFGPGAIVAGLLGLNRARRLGGRGSVLAVVSLVMGAVVTFAGIAILDAIFTSAGTTGTVLGV